jgi:hypothetical protein
MILVLGALGLVLLLLPAAPASPPRRLPASEWAIVVFAAIVVGALTVVVALVLASAPVVGSLLDAPGVVDHCRGVLAPLAPDPSVLSWSAAVLSAILFARFVRGSCRSRAKARRTRVEPWLGEHRDEGDYELVTVPTRELIAFGVPGRPPQVVVSSGLVERLDSAETAAVIAHEAAHHRLRHSTHLALLAGIEHAFGWFPPARHSSDVARAAIETWADDAIGRDPSTRHAIRTALAGMTRRTWHTDERLTRLRHRVPLSDPIVRFVSYAPVALIGITAIAILAGWLTDAHHAVALGGPCAH